MQPSETQNPAEQLKAAIQFTSFEQIEELRQRINEGERPSREEYTAALAFFRQARSAANVSAPKGKRTALTSDAAINALEALMGEG